MKKKNSEPNLFNNRNINTGGKSNYIETLNGQFNIINESSESYPSIITEVMLLLSEELDNLPKEPSKNKTYDIESKIMYNNLFKYRLLIDNYGDYGFLIDSIYDTLESQRPGHKGRLLRFIKYKYNEFLADLLSRNTKKDKVKVIRENSDNIMDQIRDEIIRIVTMSNNKKSLYKEEIEFGATIIVCKAFIDCKILENPNND